MTERRLIPIATFEAADALVIDDLGKLIEEAAERAKAAQIAEEAQPKPPTETPTARTVFAVVGAKASGWF